MNFHVEHSLFFERKKTEIKGRMSVGLTLCILMMNMGIGNTTFSFIAASIGMILLMYTYVQGDRRIASAFTWVLMFMFFVLVSGFVWNYNVSHLNDIIARIFCGMIWVLWLGTQIDWTSLRQILVAIRVPKMIVSTMDHAIMHGVLTQREWISRRNATRLRVGTSKIPLSSWAQLLGEGALQAFLRLEHVEENAWVRCNVMIPIETDRTIFLDAVDLKRGKQLVLQQLTLRVTSGEWILLCGPSGAGKSSLLRLLAGLEAPTQGTVTRLGSSILSHTSLQNRLDARVALLVQNPEHHFIASTVGEDITWGLLRRGMNPTEAHHISFEMAKDLGIDHVWERPCHDLSFGEQRRVALAGILVLAPMLLLLDEPTAGLDPVAAHELRLVVQKLVQKTGATCIWATHDLASRPTLANRTILLRKQKIIFDGPTTEGLSRPWLLRAGLAVPKKGEPTC